MKFNVDWEEYYDCEGPQTIRLLGDQKIDPRQLIGKCIVSIVDDDFFGLIFEVEE